MSTLPQPLPEGARVALVRLRSLGDCVLTAPALALLRRARPDVSTAVVVEPRFAAVFTGNPDVDDILPPSAAAVRRWRPWVCLNLHGGTRSMWLTCASGAALRAGFEHFPAPPLLYNARIPKAQAILGVNRTVHTAEHLASAVFWLGVPQAEVPRARVFPKTSSRDGHYAVIHPFASTPDKTWPADHYDHLAAALAPHIEPIFIGAPGDDLSPFRRWSVQHGSDLEDVKSLLAGASLFIGNDSGPAHMAAASGLPLVMLWGNSNPAIWSPWKCEHVLLHDPRGIAHIDVERALQAVEHLRVNA
jgi:ADP-heptose:LPS heptosyltransferase